MLPFIQGLVNKDYHHQNSGRRRRRFNWCYNELIAYMATASLWDRTIDSAIFWQSFAVSRSTSHPARHAVPSVCYRAGLIQWWHWNHQSLGGPYICESTSIFSVEHRVRPSVRPSRCDDEWMKRRRRRALYMPTTNALRILGREAIPRPWTSPTPTLKNVAYFRQNTSSSSSSSSFFNKLWQSQSNSDIHTAIPPLSRLKPRPHQQQCGSNRQHCRSYVRLCRSNIRLCRKNSFNM